MTRAEANRIIEAALTQEQREDFQYLMDARQESIDYETETYGESDSEPMDWVEALIDRAQHAEDIADCRFEDAEARKAARKDLKAYNRILVRLGFYQPISEEDAKEQCRNTSPRGRLSDYPMVDGQRYTTETTWEKFDESFK
jgi:hypothetical protein